MQHLLYAIKGGEEERERRGKNERRSLVAPRLKFAVVCFRVETSAKRTSEKKTGTKREKEEGGGKKGRLHGIVMSQQQERRLALLSLSEKRICVT